MMAAADSTISAVDTGDGSGTTNERARTHAKPRAVRVAPMRNVRRGPKTWDQVRMRSAPSSEWSSTALTRVSCSGYVLGSDS